MRFSKAELGVLNQVARGYRRVESIAKALKRGQRGVYDAIQALKNKGFVHLNRGVVQPREGLHIALLLQTLAQTPDMPNTLADGRLPLLTAILDPATMGGIGQYTGMKKSMIYAYIKELKRKNLIRTEKDTHRINHRMWPKLTEALWELRRYEEYTDPRIPPSSIIYKKTRTEIVFGSKEELDATPTAFCAYEAYGIRLLLTQNYYTLPKRDLTKTDVLLHSLYVAETDDDTRLLIFIALFYAQYRHEFSKIYHDILENIDKVLNKQRVRGFPTYEELRDRAQVYGISI